ncbi:hypothetical protein [Xenorhabdus bovienii]|uniref:hypothetical protein n=1 Tax=Xenorhabdus bovienii TaxID=40576 RepID=UPI00237D1199|nr:hypothetical protein [Xenorhabdus bovienii]MDE1481463.1 hypothetical protein [Xenorhabdus bovienii]MDE9440781.1 hypothetical protein [Xenorhabdus bovienii]
MVEIEGGDKTSAYLMCRGIYRQSKVLAEKLRETTERSNNHKNKESTNSNSSIELENTQKLSEKLHSILHLWMKEHLTEDDAYILSIATEINHNVLQEIARARGEEYS